MLVYLIIRGSSGRRGSGGPRHVDELERPARLKADGSLSPEEVQKAKDKLPA
ncbi:hypothetical protein ACIRO3_28625 [Streptomyces sp. NPDC102278]|uniref:hypothetical protein n=1 Tax=Streptomyces sp. NPDC102278 TaxID=3366152 RepID=UPI0038137FD8